MVHPHSVFINTRFQVSVQINKILFTIKCELNKKGSGIAIIVQKQVASYLAKKLLAISILQAALFTICVCSHKQNSSWVVTSVHACTNLMHSLSNLQDLILTLVGINICSTN